MDVYSNPAPTAAENRGLRKWFFAALIFSLALHLFLLIVFRQTQLRHFSAEGPQERLEPRPFSIKQAHLDPKAFEPEVESPRFTESKAPPTIPQEKPDLSRLPERLQLTPNAPDLAKPLINEKPNPMGGELPKAAQPELNPAVQRDLDLISQHLAADHAPRIAPSSTQPPGPGASGDVRGTEGRENPGFSNLDDLLSRAGPLTGSIAPLAMPGGALFEYDRADLRVEAIEQLRKLAALIHKNPGATFSIEGHTDSFGDAAYNMRLSEERAQAVKEWLVANVGVPASQIETRGFGSTRLLVPGTGTPEEQQMNRRVEIVIHTPRQ